MGTEEAGEDGVGPERGTAEWGAATVHADGRVSTGLQEKLQYISCLGLHGQVQGAPATGGLLRGAAGKSLGPCPARGDPPPHHTFSLGLLTGLLRSAPASWSSRTISASLWMTATWSGVWPRDRVTAVRRWRGGDWAPNATILGEGFVT